MRLNRGLYILGISLLFLLTGTASAGPEVVRRGETRVGVGHVKTAAEIEAFARDLEKRDPRAAKALREAVGKDVASSKEERAKYDEALRKMRDAKNDTDRAEAEREYHAVLHRALEQKAFVAKAGGEILGDSEIAKALRASDVARNALITRTPAENARIEFGLKVAQSTGMDAEVMKGIHDFHQQLIAEVEADTNRSPSEKANAELENQQTVLFLAEKIGEARRGLVKGVGEAKDTEGKMTSDAERRQAADTLQGGMDVEFAAGATGSKAKQTAEALVNLLTGKDPVTRADALAGVKLLHDTYALQMRLDVAQLKALGEIEGLSVNKAIVKKALEGLELKDRPLSEIIREVRRRLKEAGLKDADIEKVVKKLRERASEKIAKLILENKNLDKLGKEELACGNRATGQGPCVSEALLPTSLITGGLASAFRAAGIDPLQCANTRRQTTSAVRRGRQASPAPLAQPAKRGSGPAVHDEIPAN